MLRNSLCCRPSARQGFPAHGKTPRLLSRSATRNALAFSLPGSSFCQGQVLYPQHRVIRSMLYQAYQAHSDIMVPVRTWAGMAIHAFAPMNGMSGPAIKNLSATYELIARAGLTHVRPPFGIETVTVGNEEIPVVEEAAHV